MKTRRSAWKFAVLFAALATFAPAAHAGLLSDPENAGFAPRVPLSAFARPASWFDPSRLHLMSTVSVGSGFGGQTSALQVTRLSYQFGAPLSMSVSIGNSFGPNAMSGTNPFFLEGFNVTWQPNAHAMFRVEMHDVRSPLQLDPIGRGYGFGDPLRSPY